MALQPVLHGAWQRSRAGAGRRAGIDRASAFAGVPARCSDRRTALQTTRCLVCAAGRRGVAYPGSGLMTIAAMVSSATADGNASDGNVFDDNVLDGNVLDGNVLDDRDR